MGAKSNIWEVWGLNGKHSNLASYQLHMIVENEDCTVIIYGLRTKHAIRKWLEANQEKDTGTKKQTLICSLHENQGWIFKGLNYCSLHLHFPKRMMICLYLIATFYELYDMISSLRHWDVFYIYKGRIKTNKSSEVSFQKEFQL